MVFKNHNTHPVQSGILVSIYIESENQSRDTEYAPLSCCSWLPFIPDAGILECFPCSLECFPCSLL